MGTFEKLHRNTFVNFLRKHRILRYPHGRTARDYSWRLLAPRWFARCGGVDFDAVSCARIRACASFGRVGSRRDVQPRGLRNIVNLFCALCLSHNQFMAPRSIPEENGACRKDSDEQTKKFTSGSVGVWRRLSRVLGGAQKHRTPSTFHVH